MSQADELGPAGVDHGPAAREVDRPAPTEGELERAIAAQVRRLRLVAGLTVGEMALRVGISKAMLSRSRTPPPRAA